ncbi:hypothetical protein D3C84_663240 [compost metagenome]
MIGEESRRSECSGAITERCPLKRNGAVRDEVFEWRAVGLVLGWVEVIPFAIVEHGFEFFSLGADRRGTDSSFGNIGPF